jgi:hypothetical protein
MFQKLESVMLALGLHLFGNKVYPNTLYMETTYATVLGGS